MVFTGCAVFMDLNCNLNAFLITVYEYSIYQYVTNMNLWMLKLSKSVRSEDHLFYCHILLSKSFVEKKRKVGKTHTYLGIAIFRK